MDSRWGDTGAARHHGVMTTPAGGPAIEVIDEPWGSELGTTLVDALLADLDVRYGPWDGSALTPPPGPPPDGAWPAPQSAPPADGRWAVAPDAVRRPLGTFLVAWSEGRAVGCGALRPLPGGRETDAEIKRMFTIAEVRGRGVGRAVLAHLEGTARELGYQRMFLATGTAQPEAMALCVSASWSPVAPYGDYCGAEQTRCFGLVL